MTSIPQVRVSFSGRTVNQLLRNDHPAIFHESISGDPQLPVLVFLHEGLGCTEMWGEFPRRLCGATGCRGLAYDRNGYGKSASLERSRTIDYMHEAARAELPRLIAALIPEEPYVLVGHSDGGSIALIHAAQRPALLRGVITEAAHVFVEPMALDGIRRAEAAYELGKLQGLARYHGEKTHAIFKAWSGTWLSPWFAHWNIEGLLPSIACPVLVIQGRDDEYGTEDQVKAIVSGSRGVAVPAMIDNCGHTPHREAADAVTRLMREFIASVS
jgi:pimeloyl-ACP methyl ester carboxylesterase